jgi:hypothetical protein
VEATPVFVVVVVLLVALAGAKALGRQAGLLGTLLCVPHGSLSQQLLKPSIMACKRHAPINANLNGELRV